MIDSGCSQAWRRSSRYCWRCCRPAASRPIWVSWCWLLTLLAGPAVAAALRPISSWRGQLDPWLLLALELILLATAAQCLPSALHPTNKADWVQVYTALGILTASMAGLLWLVYGVFGSWRTVAEVLPVVLLIGGTAWGASQLTALSFDRGAGRQSGILTVMPDAGGLADLRGSLRELASLKGSGGGETRLDLMLPTTQSRTLAPVLQWELRKLPNLRVLQSLPADRAPIVITVADKAAAPGETYGGAAFSVLQRWRPESLKDVEFMGALAALQRSQGAAGATTGGAVARQGGTVGWLEWDNHNILEIRSYAER